MCGDLGKFIQEVKHQRKTKGTVSEIEEKLKKLVQIYFPEDRIFPFVKSLEHLIKFYFEDALQMYFKYLVAYNITVGNLIADYDANKQLHPSSVWFYAFDEETGFERIRFWKLWMEYVVGFVFTVLSTHIFDLFFFCDFLTYCIM